MRPLQKKLHSKSHTHAVLKYPDASLGCAKKSIPTQRRMGMSGRNIDPFRIRRLLGNLLENQMGSGEVEVNHGALDGGRKRALITAVNEHAL